MLGEITGVFVLVRTALAISFLCLVGFAAWQFRGVLATEDDGFLQWRDPAVTSTGRTLYATNCAGCHGVLNGSAASAADVAGRAPPLHDESGHTWQHPDFALFQLVRDGIAVANCVPVDPDSMPKFKGIINDSELVAILSYIKSTWPNDIRQSHDQVNTMYGPYNRAVEELIDVNSGKRG